LRAPAVPRLKTIHRSCCSMGEPINERAQYEPPTLTAHLVIGSIRVVKPNQHSIPLRIKSEHHNRLPPAGRFGDPGVLHSPRPIARD
jgi:hypothetical protein